VQQRELVVLSLRQPGSTSQSSIKEPKISLPTKFHGTCSQFRGFLNKLCLVINMHPNRYPSDGSRVGLVGPSMVCTITREEIPNLKELETFIVGFQASFNTTYSLRTTINKIRRVLRQGDQPA
jgi:hypothetical protein